MNTKIKGELRTIGVGLDLESRASLVDLLNVTLADEQLLYTKTLNFHWNVTGPLFHQIHVLLEEHYQEMQSLSDEIAERARMLGGSAIGSFAEFQEVTRLSESPGEIPTAEEMVTILVEDHESFITNLRQDTEAAMEEYDDQGTGDLLIGVLRAHEKMAWMLRSLIEENKN
jgi:starvation-inducible DNA-binding protein